MGTGAKFLIFFCIVSSAFSKEFSVVTYNTWQLPFFSRQRRNRLRKLPSALKWTHADIISLEEVWLDIDKKYLIRKLASEYPYHFFSRHGLNFSNGLLVLSKFPIVQTAHVMAFTVNTDPREAVARKGALHLNLRLPSGTIDYFVTHLGAIRYDRNSLEYNEVDLRAHGVQLAELSQFISRHSKHDVQLLTGDLNFDPEIYDRLSHHFVPGTTSPPYNLLTQELGFIDTFHTLNASANVPTLSFDNVWWKAQAAPEQYIDYIFVKQKTALIRPKFSSVVMQDVFSAVGGPLSDHFGVLTTFED